MKTAFARGRRAGTRARRRRLIADVFVTLGAIIVLLIVSTVFGVLLGWTLGLILPDWAMGVVNWEIPGWGDHLFRLACLLILIWAVWTKVRRRD